MPALSYSLSPPFNRYVIGLDRSPERTKTFFEHNKHIPNIKYCRGCDGNKLDLKKLNDATMLPDADWLPGSVGCGLSHVFLWKKSIELNKPVTILEVDTVLCKNFDEESRWLLSELPDNWDMILWGHNTDCPMKVSLPPRKTDCIIHCDHENIMDAHQDYQKCHINSSVIRLLYAMGSPSYSVTPKGAKKLLDYCLPFRREPIGLMNRSTGKPSTYTTTFGFDMMMCKIYPLIEAYIAFPFLSVVPNKLVSDID